MFNFELDHNGELRASPSRELVERVSLRMERTCRLIKAVRSEIPNKGLTCDAAVLAKHPAAHGLYAFKQGYLPKAHASKLLGYLAEIPDSRVERLKGALLTVEQKQILIPEADTRGARMLVEEEGRYTYDFLDADLAVICRLLGPEWYSSLQINTVSFVQVAGMPDLPHFSGSTNDLWGAMHMTAPSSRFVLAESLTHESSHFWVHCLEELRSLSDHTWDREEWVSAWREDPRPIGGVIHGVHVFSCVSVSLARLCVADSPSDSAVGRAQRERLAYVIAQVEDGIRECQRSGLLHEAGRQIVEWAADRLRGPREVVGSRELSSMQERVASKRRLKQTKWRERGLLQ